MKINKYASAFVLAAFFFSGCTSNSAGSASKKQSENQMKQASSTNTNLVANSGFELSVWNSVISQKDVQYTLGNIYASAKLKYTPYDDTNKEKVLDMLNSDDVPDIMFVDSSYLSNINSIDGIEDLLKKPYNGAELKQFMTDAEWNRYLSFDGKTLVALPLSPSPGVTYYRADILEQNGITSDPQKLGDLMQDPKQWLKMAETLAKNGKLVMQWKDELLGYYIDCTGIFDKDMNFNLNTRQMADIIDVTRAAAKMGTASYANQYRDNGQLKIKNGEVAMVYMGGRWGEDNIDAWTKDSSAAGKWKVTRLPMGINAEIGSMCMIIPSKSKRKVEAWNLAQRMFIDQRNYFTSLENQPSTILSNQMSNILYKELRNEIPYRYYTPLDDDARAYMQNELNLFYESQQDSAEFLNNLQNKLYGKFSDERRLLKETLSESK